MSPNEADLPYVLDPTKLPVAVVPCEGCGGAGVVPEEQWETDPGAEDIGVRACCEGYGVQLNVPEGAKKLIAFLAIQGIYASSYPDEHETESEVFLSEVKEQQLKGELRSFRR